MLSADDLENVVRRAAKKLPPFGYGTPKEMYRLRLLQVLENNILFLRFIIAVTFVNCKEQYIRLAVFVLTNVLVCLCVRRLHYIEYLVGLIGRYKLDPISILDLVEVSQELRRRGKELPERSASCSDQEYRNICVKVRECLFATPMGPTVA